MRKHTNSLNAFTFIGWLGADRLGGYHKVALVTSQEVSPVFPQISRRFLMIATRTSSPQPLPSLKLCEKFMRPAEAPGRDRSLNA
jgi:hypothetical protein